MGAQNSKIEEDKALQLCRERKKFVKQALDGRCSLAGAHVDYIHSLRSIGTALRKFVEPEARIAPSFYTSTTATPEQIALTEHTPSQFSLSSPPFSHNVDATESTISPTPSTPISSRIHINHMKFSVSSARDVEERVPSPVTGTVVFSSTPQSTTPRSSGLPDNSPFSGHHAPAEAAPWDYFGLFHPIDDNFPSQEGKGLNQGFENTEDMKRLREEEGIPDLEDDEGKASLHGTQSQESEDEFDEPSTDTLVRRFQNVNRMTHQGMTSSSTAVPSARSATSETEVLNEEKGNSPNRSTLRDTSSAVDAPTGTKKTPNRGDYLENNISPKDFVSSIKHIELLFIKASESGKEVPRMLEANKLQLSPIFPAKESASIVSVYIKACFSCGQERRQVQEEPAQAAIKYLTWHGTVSSPSSSSQNPLSMNSKDETQVANGSLFDNFCMVSGSHASTLDRLYAWERKLSDEVKACEMIRKDYDSKCKILRQLESMAESSVKIDKTRADVKDLHSRIRVALHRIDSISKKIEDLRDKELQPQLEELIEALSRMWEAMTECHRLQYLILAVAPSNNTQISVQSESHRQITLHLESELSSLSSNFIKWTESQKFYLEAINRWLSKCVWLQEKTSRRKRKAQPPQLRNLGPPIYATCDEWLKKLNNLPSKEVADSIKALAADIHRFLPRQEKNQGKSMKRLLSNSLEADNIQGVNTLRDQSPEDLNSSFDDFRSSLVEFLGKLSKYSESSVDMYRKLKGTIEEAKNHYDRLLNSRRQT